MLTNKKAAFLIYPMFCIWEIALVLATLQMYEKKVEVYAIDRNPVVCEEGMHIVPSKALNVRTLFGAK